MAVTGASLNPIYQRLNGADEYHPFDADTFSDWSMEAGDVVTVSRGSDSYQSPIHSMKVVWKGAPQTTISSTGKKERDTVTKQAKRKYGRGGSGLRSSQGLGHKIEETDEHWQSMYWDGYNGLSSRIEQTASYWQAEFNNMYDGLRGFVEITAEHWHAEFEDSYNGLIGYVDQTAEHWHAEFEDSYNGLVGYVDQTAEHWHSEFEDSYNGLIGYVDATADHWETVINSTASSIRASLKVTADTVAAVVQGTGDNAYIKPAVIKASIDADTGSLIVLSADRVKLDANTTISGVLGVENGGLKVKGSAVIDGTMTMTSGNNIVAGTIRATSIDFPGENPGSYISLTASEADSMIVKANLDTSTNTLQLWKRGDPAQSPSITFSKATTLTPSWGSGSNTFTVTATQSGVTVGSVSVSPIVQPVTSQGGSYVDIYVATNKETAPYYDTHGDPKKLYLVQVGLRVDLKDQDSTTSGTVYAQKTIPAATVSGNWDGGTWTATSTHGGSASVTPIVQPVSSQGGAYVDLYVATTKSTSPYYDTHGSVKKLYLVNSNLTVSLKSENSTSSGTVYAQKTLTDSNLAAGNIKSGVTIFGVTGNYGGNHSVTLTWNGTTGTNAGSTNNIKGVCSTATTYDYIKMYSSSGTIYVRHNTSASAVESSGTIIAKLTDGNLSAGNIKNGVSIFGVTGSYAPVSTVTAEWQQSNPQSSANPYNKYVIKRDGNTLSNLTITVTAGASISYNSSAHTYTATGTASAGGSQRGSATATSGTEAYSAGFDTGVANSWFVYTTSTYNDQGPLAPNTRIEIGYTDLNGNWHRRGTWSTPSSGGGGTIERIIDVYPVDDNDVEMDHDITISSPINIRACATYATTTSEYVQYRYGSTRIKITPSGGSDHPNSVTFTKGSMTTEQAGGHTIYRFTYSLTNTTGSWPYSGRTTFYY